MTGASVAGLGLPDWGSLRLPRLLPVWAVVAGLCWIAAGSLAAVTWAIDWRCIPLDWDCCVAYAPQMWWDCMSNSAQACQGCSREHNTGRGLPEEADGLGDGRHVVGFGEVVRSLETHQAPRRVGDQDAEAAQHCARISQHPVHLSHQACRGYAVRMHEAQVLACRVAPLALEDGAGRQQAPPAQDPLHGKAKRRQMGRGGSWHHHGVGRAPCSSACHTTCVRVLTLRCRCAEVHLARPSFAAVQHPGTCQLCIFACPAFSTACWEQRSVCGECA